MHILDKSIINSYHQYIMIQIDQQVKTDKQVNHITGGSTNSEKLRWICSNFSFLRGAVLSSYLETEIQNRNAV